MEYTHSWFDREYQMKVMFIIWLRGDTSGGEKDNKSSFTYWQKNKNFTNLSTLAYLSFLSSDAETPERQNIRKAHLHMYVYILYMYVFRCNTGLM